MPVYEPICFQLICSATLVLTSTHTWTEIWSNSAASTAKPHRAGWFTDILLSMWIWNVELMVEIQWICIRCCFHPDCEGKCFRSGLVPITFDLAISHHDKNLLYLYLITTYPHLFPMTFWKVNVGQWRKISTFPLFLSPDMIDPGRSIVQKP